MQLTNVFLLKAKELEKEIAFCKGNKWVYGGLERCDKARYDERERTLKEWRVWCLKQLKELKV
jgi:hypothetical protein